MSITDNVVNVALLGTVNRELTSEELPDDLAGTLERLKAESADGEEVFYKGAAAFFAYYRSGLEPLKLKDAGPVSEAEPETKPYAGRKAATLLNILLGEKYANMLLFWYRKASESGKLIPPEYLPDVLGRVFLPGSQTAKRERQVLASLIGNRGRWLLPMMGYAAMQEEGDDMWETAIHADRKQILSRVRLQEPARAIEMLRGEWKKESAQHRAEFIACLEIGLSSADEEFLEEVREGDRSSTVREEALRLLRMLPGSRIQNMYAGILKEHLRYRRLFGWSVDPITYSEELKKTGINEMSSNKGESDSDYILRQMAQYMPLSFWCELLDCDAETVARRLRKSPPFPKYINLIGTILNFKDREWAFYTLKDERIVQAPDLMQLVPLLSVEQREVLNLSGKVDRNFYINQWFGEDDCEWGETFSRGVLGMIYGMDYCYYDRPTCEALALRLPVSLYSYVADLGSAKANSASHREFTVRLQQLLLMKKDIVEAFKDSRSY